MKWQNAYVFISSTFNDMHAERDFLVKRVFPELRLWCRERKIKLIDIDLRWGVSEKDASENKKVVDICLQNIDKCRPFFLCFLGQRRGWVPVDRDINEETLQKYPGLSRYLGRQSITELEIIHALLEPLTKEPSPIPNALFYFRDPDYLEDIRGSKAAQIFSSDVDASERLEDFKKDLQQNHAVYTYHSVWDPKMKSSELDGLGDPELTVGRLKQFEVQGQSLAEHVIDQLKQVISAQYPDRTSVSEQADDLTNELDHQDGYLFSATESYIERPVEEAKILDYVMGKENKPYILEAAAGSGKTSLLAHIIMELPEDRTVYRFIGTSQASSDVGTLLGLLYQEMQRRGFLTAAQGKEAQADTRVNFQNVLNQLAAYWKRNKQGEGPLILVLDALDQFSLEEEIPYWIPTALPEEIRLVISLKINPDSQCNRYLHENGYQIHGLGAMSGENEKRRMIEGYLGQFLKTVDEKQIRQLTAMKGSANPLYLKIVLNELRIHGSFESLQGKLDGDYGSTPVQAFERVLERMEQEQFVEMKNYKELFIITMAMTAFSLEGIDIPYSARLLVRGINNFKGQNSRDLADTMYVIAKHLSSYMIMDGTRMDFLYDSFRQAVKRRYSPFEMLARKMLIIGYRILVNRNAKELRYLYGTGSDLVSLAHHGIHHSIEEADKELLSPWFVTQYCKKVGATALAEVYYAAAKLAKEPKAYEQMADALISAQANITVYPDIVLYELINRIGGDHPLLSQLLQKAEHLPGQFFEQSYAQKDYIKPRKELLAFQGGREYLHCYLHTGYASFLRHNSGVFPYPDDDHGTVVLQSLVTGKVEKMLKLRDAVFADCEDANHLYLFYQGKTCEILEIPSLRSVYYGEAPALPEGFHWHIRVKGYDNEILGIYSNETGEQRLIDLKTGQTLRYYQAPDRKKNVLDLQWYFYGSLMLEENRLEHRYILVDLRTGQEIYRYDGDDLVRFASDGTVGYLVRCNQNLAVACCVRREEGGCYVGEEKEMIPRVTSGSYSVAEGCLLAFLETQMWIYDSQIRCLGYKNTSGEMYERPIEETIHPTQGADYINLEGDVIRFYDIKTMMESPIQTMDRPQDRELRDVMIQGDHLYLFFGGEIDKIHLDSHRIMHDEDASVRYHTNAQIRRLGSDVLLGHSGDKYRHPGEYRIVLKRQSNLETLIRQKRKTPEGMMLEESYYVNRKVGLIFCDQEDEEVRIYDPHGVEDKIRVHRQVIMETTDFENFDTWDLEIKSRDVEMFEYMNEYYLRFSEVYVDDTHYEVRIYHIGTRKCVCSLSLPGCSSVYTLPSFYAGGKVYMDVRIYNSQAKENHYHLFEMDFMTGETRDIAIPQSFSVLGHSEEEAYLSFSDYNGSNPRLVTLTLATGQLSEEIPLLPERRFVKKVIKKYGGYLVQYSGGIVDVYLPDTGEWIFGQALEVGTLLDLGERGEFVIVSEGGRYYTYHLQNMKNIVEYSRQQEG